MDDLLTDFLTETNESLAELDVALVRLERTPDDRDTLGLIFRLVHTIKGTCGFLGLARLESVAHAAENVLGRVRDGELAVTPDMVTLILAALDVVKAIVGGLAATGQEPGGDDAALIAALNRLADGVRAPVDAQPVAAAPPAVAAPALAPAPAPAPAQAQAQAPVPAASSPAMRISADAAPGAPAPSADAAGAAESRPEAGAQTIRVAVDVLEELMTLVSELVLTRNQLLQLARSQDGAAAALAAPLQRLSHLTSDLQEGVMKTRMQPIGNAWNKLPRLVRDLSHELGKKIELVMLGADTELDRQVLELIKDPLTHMVRNSADHGLEGPEARRAAGKPEQGRVTLNAYHEGGHILIEVSDDGAGLPVDKIRAKALANGLATEAELAAMTDTQIQRFIFRAGLSTASAVTAVSGRGVGMDVVKTNIERIGGSIDLRSRLGQGTTFTIKIPLTLAIVSALIVEAAGERFAIPQISVVELVRAGGARDAGAAGDGAPAGVERINGTPVLRLRDRLLPLVHLDALLGLRAAADDLSQSTVVIAQVGASLLGLLVDRVFDTEEIVVKPVAPILRHITMFSGNTILGDGSVIMILDPNGIARASGVGAGADGAEGVQRRPGDARGAERGAGRHGEVTRTGDDGRQTTLLLFRAAGGARMAVPLGLVARLEEIARDTIEESGGGKVVQYRGRLMPLIPLGDAADADVQNDRVPVLVFADGTRSLGLMVEEIIDVVDDALRMELAGGRPGLLGTAIIAGRATEVIDTGYWLERGSGDWFRPAAVAATAQRRVLVVEDSAFFRHMLVPVLSAAGYAVTSCADATEALRLRDAGECFEAIISDIEMPGIDGLGFARAVRAGPGSGAEGASDWSALPMIALSGRTDAAAIRAGRNAGFTDYVGKFDRASLLSSLDGCLSADRRDAADLPALARAA